MVPWIVCLIAATLAADAPLRPPHTGGVYVVAHRGAHEGIPENTLVAYQKAIDLGCDFVEIDVRTTKEGRFVSVHNADVEFYTGGAVKGRVRDMTLDELRALDIGSRVGPEWKDVKIPTFEEILDLCKGKIGIYLDLKDADVEPLIEMIRARGMERDVLWYAGPAKLRRVRELCPECIIMPDPGPEKNLDRVLAEFRPLVVASTWDNYSQTFAEKCRAAGAKVIVDDGGPSTWLPMLSWETDGIQTDRPAELITRLVEESRRHSDVLVAPPSSAAQ